MGIGRQGPLPGQFYVKLISSPFIGVRDWPFFLALHRIIMFKAIEARNLTSPRTEYVSSGPL
jgi:hypothetical protein